MGSLFAATGDCTWAFDSVGECRSDTNPNWAPSDPNYSASQLSVRVAALPDGGRVTLSDGVTPVRVHETLTVGQLTSLKFAPSARATTVSTFAYTVTNPSAGSTPGSVLIAAGVAPCLPRRRVLRRRNGIGFYRPQ